MAKIIGHIPVKELQQRMRKSSTRRIVPGLRAKIIGRITITELRWRRQRLK